MKNIPKHIRRIGLSLALIGAILLVPVLAYAAPTMQDISIPIVVSKPSPR